MTTQNHPIAAEELMAYLDSELAPEQARAAATHLEACTECQKLAADLRGVSQAMNTWEVEAKSATLPKALSDVFEERTDQTQPRLAMRRPWYRRAWFWGWAPALAGGAVVATLIVTFSSTRLHYDHLASLEDNRSTPSSSARVAPPAAGPVATQSKPIGTAQVQESPSAKYDVTYFSGDELPQTKDWAAKGKPLAASATPLPTGPMIIRTAELSLTSREFDKGRTQVEDILKRHHGYVGTLHVTNVGSGRTLTASLRIPSADLDAALAELKTLGRLTSESKTGQEVTAQYVDLQARLANSRNTEQRLIELLRNRTGKLSDVLEVENELARVRGEVESMEAERKTLSNQVAFATLNLTLNEDFRAQLQVVPPSTSTRLINAAVDGYRSMVDGLMSDALFFLTSGPTLLVWTAILFLPARFLWRKFRRTFA